MVQRHICFVCLIQTSVQYESPELYNFYSAFHEQRRVTTSAYKNQIKLMANFKRYNIFSFKKYKQTNWLNGICKPLISVEYFVKQYKI